MVDAETLDPVRTLAGRILVPIAAHVGGTRLIDNLQLTASYTATVNDNDDDDLQMDGFRLSIVFGWHPLIEGMNRLQGEP